MRRMDWDTQKPDNVSRCVWLPRGVICTFTNIMMMVYTAMIAVVPQKNSPFCAVMSAICLAQRILRLLTLLAPAYHGWRWKHPVIERQE